MFPHSDIHKYAQTSLGGKTHNHIEHVLTDKRWHSSVDHVKFLRQDNCDTNHYLVVAEIRQRLSVSE
jgi:hypothetical protein